MKLVWRHLDERRATLVSALMIAVGPVSLALYTPALPTLAQAFGTGPGPIKLTLTLYFFGFCLAQLICGPLSDALGRRPVALWFFALYLAGSLTALAAQDVLTLQIGRAMQGVGAAAGVAISRALVRDLFTGQASARILNRIGLLVGLVPALSPAIGGVLLEGGHWRAIFAAMAIFAVGLLAAMTFLLPETNAARDRASLAPARVAANYGALLSDLRFLAPTATMGFLLGAIYTLPSILPFVLIGKLGLSPLQYSGALLFQTGGLLVGNLVAGRLMRRAAARALVGPGVCVAALAGCVFAALGFWPQAPWPAFIFASSLWVFALPFVSPGATVAALAPFPAMAGAASALIGFLQMGGGFLGSALASLFVDPVHAVTTLMPAAAVCLILCFLLGARAQERA